MWSHVYSLVQGFRLYGFSPVGPAIPCLIRCPICLQLHGSALSFGPPPLFTLQAHFGLGVLSCPACHVLPHIPKPHVNHSQLPLVGSLNNLTYIQYVSQYNWHCTVLLPVFYLVSPTLFWSFVILFIFSLCSFNSNKLLFLSLPCLPPSPLSYWTPPGSGMLPPPLCVVFACKSNKVNYSSAVCFQTS